MQTRADLLHPDGNGAARVPPGIFISTPERAPEDAANDPSWNTLHQRTTAVQIRRPNRLRATSP